MSSKHLDCTSARPHLALHAGGDLESALAEQVEIHLGGCAACRAELGHAQLARERIALLGQSDADRLASVDLWPAIQQRLSAERATATRESPRLRRVSWLALPLAAAAALVLMFNRGETPLTPEGTPPSPMPPAELATNLVIDAQMPTPLANGLRRAAPGDERLRDSASPMYLPAGGLLRRGGAGSPNSLAGDDGLR